MIRNAKLAEIFTCYDGNCIAAKLRCDKFCDCAGTNYEDETGCDQDMAEFKTCVQYKQQGSKTNMYYHMIYEHDTAGI